jgi:hypothetical protein
VWPQTIAFEEEEEIRTYHAAALIEQYIKRLGLKRVFAIIESSNTGEEVQERILQHIELSEVEEELSLGEQTIGACST